jgi:hypothetical protein
MQLFRGCSWFAPPKENDYLNEAVFAVLITTKFDIALQVARKDNDVAQGMARNLHSLKPLEITDLFLL